MEQTELNLVLFKSRNKDNKNTVENYKERQYLFLTHYTKEDVNTPEFKKEFDEFVQKGKPNELSRCYMSVNDDFVYMYSKSK